jgi:hypothetical protein
MNPNDQIQYLQTEKEKKEQEIKDIDQQIDLLKSSRKFKEKHLKLIIEELNANTEQKKG